MVVDIVYRGAGFDCTSNLASGFGEGGSWLAFAMDMDMEVAEGARLYGLI